VNRGKGGELGKKRKGVFRRGKNYQGEEPETAGFGRWSTRSTGAGAFKGGPNRKKTLGT